MPLYDYFCKACQLKFEQISPSGHPDPIPCPKCKGTETDKLISSFAVGGRGDQRESTVHGCHGCHGHVSPSSGDHSTPHSHDSGSGD